MAYAQQPANDLPGRGLQFWSIALPLIKCLMCPACLTLLGTLFAGAHLSLLDNERIHGVIVAAALVADVAILGVAFRYHRNRWPLLLCLVGGVLALAGHELGEATELAGFGILMVAGLYNVILLRRCCSARGSCCAPGSESGCGST